MIQWVRKMIGPRWHTRCGPMTPHDYNRATDALPKVEGWFRVMVDGDSESCDGFTIYDYPDYEAWAYFTPDEDGGNFVGDHDEDNYNIFAWCGPFNAPRYAKD